MRKIILMLMLQVATYLITQAQSIPVSGNQYHLYGPNGYNVNFQVGGHNRLTTDASIYASNGNLHLDSKPSYAIYLNHYSSGNTYMNRHGGFVGIGTESPQEKLAVIGNVQINGTYPYLSLKSDNWTQDSYIQAGINLSGNATGDYLSFQIPANNGFNFSNNGVNRFVINPNGNVGIGTITPQEKLSVNGKIRAHEIKVETDNWPDYVFEREYNVRTLESLESYIKQHKHLPETPSAKEVEINGIALGEMNKLLLKKIEELTLHLIQKNKEIKDLETRMERLEAVRN